MTAPPGLDPLELISAARADGGVARVRDLVRVCESAIVRAGLSGFNSMGSPRKDARALVFETLAIRDHSDGYLDAAVTAPEKAAILDLLERRVSGPTPVPYLTGEAFYAGRRFTVRPGVFIPRNAIAYVLDELLAEVRWSAPPRALEVACGSGALGVTVALRRPDALVDLADVDPLAVEVALANAARHRVDDRVRATVSDMFAAVDPDLRYDLVLANLPYVPDEHQAHTNGEIDAEPPAAVYRPGDGLDLVRVALSRAAAHLAETGLLVLEVGTENEPAVQASLGGRGTWWRVKGRAVGVVSLTRAELKE